MSRRPSIVVLFLIVFGLSFPATTSLARAAEPADDSDRPKEMEVFEQGVGTWRLQHTVQREGEKPEAGTGQSTVGYILGGHFAAQSATTGELEHFHVFTYDPNRKSYRSWYFNSDGRNGGWTGSWDPQTKIFTWQGGLKSGGEGSRRIQFLGDNAVKWTVNLRNADGELYHTREVVAERTKEKKDPVPAPAKGPAAEPAELAVLDALAGSWQCTAVVAPTDGQREDVKYKTRTERKWVLGGQFLYEKSDSGLFLYTYSPDAKAFQMFEFLPDGNASQWTGQWDAAAKTMTLTADLGGGVSGKTVCRMVDADHMNWSYATTGADGKVQSQAEGACTRAKD